MNTVTSFHVSGVAVDHVSAILDDYFEFERLRAYRRRFVARFSVLAIGLGILGFGFHWLSAEASWTSLGLCAIAPIWAWAAELRCKWRLGRSLGDLPPDACQMVIQPGP